MSTPPLASSPQDVSTSKLDAILIGLIVAAVAAVLCFSAWRGYLDFPFSDAHAWTARVLDASSPGALASAIWAPAGQQRIPLAIATQAIELQTHTRAFLFAGLAAMTFGLASLAWLIRDVSTAAGHAAWLLLLNALIVLNLGLAEDLAFPVFSVYAFVAGPALASFAWLGLRQARASRVALILLLVSAGLASCGNAAGLAVWPALITSAVMSRRPHGEMVLLVVAGAVCITLFEFGLSAPVRSLPGPDKLGKMLVYLGRFGGLPYSWALPPGAIGAAPGWIVELGAVGLVFHRWRRREPVVDPLSTCGVGLVVFGLLVAVMATVGRVDELPQPIVPTRYTPFASLLQVGALLCAAPWMTALVRWRPASTAVLLAAGLACLMAQVKASGIFVATSQHVRQASEAFDEGRPSPWPGIKLNADAAEAHVVRERLKRRKALVEL